MAATDTKAGEPFGQGNVAGAGWSVRAVIAGVGVWAIVLVVYVYRATLGQVMGGCCRYDPSCSQYMIDAVRAYGPVRGFWRGLKRMARCHPWGGCGYDPARVDRGR